MADDEIGDDDLGLPSEDGGDVTFPEDGPQKTGHGRSARKTANREEQDSITCFAAMLLSQNMTKGDVKRQLQKRYAVYNFSPRSIEAYLSRARAKVQEWSGLDASNVRESVSGMLFGLTFGHLKVSERLQVIDRLVLLFGLNAPAKFAETNPDGTALTDDERNTIRQHLLSRLGVRPGGPASPQPLDPDRPPLAGPLSGDVSQRDAGGPVAEGASPVGGAEADNLL